MRKTAVLLTLGALLWGGTAEARLRHPKPTVITMRATAFARAQKPTAAGTVAHEGIVAADPNILPLGSLVRITGAGAYNGTYLVSDTGAGVKGRRIDIYMPSRAEAKRFGTKIVRVQIRNVGEGKQDAREKDGASLDPRESRSESTVR